MKTTNRAQALKDRENTKALLGRMERKMKRWKIGRENWKNRRYIISFIGVFGKKDGKVNGNIFSFLLLLGRVEKWEARKQKQSD